MNTFKATTYLSIFSIFMLVFTPSGNGDAIFRSEHGKGTVKKEDPNNLTDKEKWTSKNYVHEGLLQRKLLEECEVDEKTKSACQGQAAEKKFLGMSPTMVQAIARMYTTVIGTAGGDMVTVSEYDKANPDDSPKKEAKKEKIEESKEPSDKNADDKSEETQGDYCKYIAVGTETIALAQQQLAQKNIEETPSTEGSEQKNALLKAARMHDERSTQAKTQTTGWGAATVCYGAMMAMPSVSGKAWQNWAKLAASGVLTAFFKGQIDAHADYRDKAKAIADKLPGKGDCNPITEKDCYCSQPETKYDPNICQKHLHNTEKVSKDAIAVSCLDKELKADPKCHCLVDDDCYDKQFSNKINGLNFGKAQFSNASKPFRSLARGQIKGGKLGSATSNAFAKSQDALRKVNSKFSNLRPRNLSASQNKEALALEKLGVSKNLANRLASLPINSKMKNAMNSFGNAGNYRSNLTQGPSRRNRVMKFRGGDGLVKKKARKRKNNNFLSRFNKKKRKGSSNKIMKFAQEAQNNAQINGSKGRIIFDIISERYQLSAWRRLSLLETEND